MQENMSCTLSLIQPWTLPDAGQLKGWLDAHFLQALQLAQMQTFAVEVPLLSTVKAALAHLAGAGTKRDFACRLAYGLGANLTSEGQSKLAVGLSRLLGEADILYPVSVDPLSLIRSAYNSCPLFI